MVLKNFRKIEKDEVADHANILDNEEPLWKYDLYFADSLRYYDTDFIRARDNRVAKRKIKRRYPHSVKFEWGLKYAK